VRLGILGGSFDPVHLGHVAAARAVLERTDLARVEFVVAAQPPHKGACSASFHDRVEMVRLALAGIDDLGVEDLEGRREGPSFTFYTVTELSSGHPGRGLALLVGADMLADLPNWHRAQELVAAVDVIAFARPGFAIVAARKAFGEAFAFGRLECVEVPRVKVSSTGIRARIATGRSLTGLVHPRVAAYIEKGGLYLPQDRG